MIERIITACSKPGDWVLDPFGGSGTVAVVCKKLDRNCLSIDLDPQYCQEARARIAK